MPGPLASAVFWGPSQAVAYGETVKSSDLSEHAGWQMVGTAAVGAVHGRTGNPSCTRCCPTCIVGCKIVDGCLCAQLIPVLAGGESVPDISVKDALVCVGQQ